MIHQLELTRSAFVRAIAAAPFAALFYDEGLTIVLVRLLALAVAVTAGKPRRDAAAGVAVPKEYRRWPHLDCEAPAQRLRLFVCPKAAATSDDDAFPVGAILVVETVRLDGGRDPQTASVFVLMKVSSVRSRAETCGSLDGWAYAMYGLTRRSISDVATVSGLCRLSVGQA